MGGAAPIATPAEELAKARKEAAELLEYIKRLEAAYDAATKASTRHALQGIIQARQNELQALNAKVSTGEAARGGVASRAMSAAGGGAGAVLTAVSGAAGLVVDSFKALVGISNTLGSALAPFTQLVQAFDPGVAARFSMALEDLTASLGRSFVPLIEAGTEVADILNALFTSLAPTILPVVEEVSRAFVDLAQIYFSAYRPVYEALARLFGQLVTALRPLIDDAAPLLNQWTGLLTDVIAIFEEFAQGALPTVVDGLRLLATVTTEVVMHMRAAIATLNHVISNLNVANAANALRGEGPLAPEAIARAYTEALQRVRNQPAPEQLDRTQRTFAARPASVVGIEDIGRNARLAAFSGRSAEERTAENTAAMRELLLRWLPPERREAAREALDALDFRGG